VRAAAAVAAIVLASCTSRRLAAEPAAPRVEAYEHRLFTITLAKGWSVVREREEAMPLGNYVDEEAGGAARFEDGKGGFFEVIIPCEETDVAGDAMWHCPYDAATRSVAACIEQPPCTREWQEECLRAARETELGDEDLCLCTAGDGKLTIWATLGEVEMRNTCLLFGNSKQEVGVDLDVFRQMVKSFRGRARPHSSPSD
jgi:ferredoxin